VANSTVMASSVGSGAEHSHDVIVNFCSLGLCFHWVPRWQITMLSATHSFVHGLHHSLSSYVVSNMCRIILLHLNLITVVEIYFLVLCE